MFKKHVRNEKGFTMIEMMVVLIIIAVLIAGGIKFYLGYIENAKVTKSKANITVMQAALDAYYSEKGAYPQTNAELLNAGIRTTATALTLEAVDPWGSANNYMYVISVADPVNKGHYVIRTGYATVQGVAVTYVAGEGKDGNILTSAEVTTDIVADGA